MDYYFIFADGQKPQKIENKTILKQLSARAGYVKDQVINIQDNCNMNLKVVSCTLGKVVLKVLLGTVTL